jgi:hypothetical protein
MGVDGRNERLSRFPELPPLPRISHVPQRACLLKSLGVAAILNRGLASGEWHVASGVWRGNGAATIEKTPLADGPTPRPTVGMCELRQVVPRAESTSWHRFPLSRGRSDVATWRRDGLCRSVRLSPAADRLRVSTRWAIGGLGNDDTT